VDEERSGRAPRGRAQEPQEVQRLAQAQEGRNGHHRPGKYIYNHIYTHTEFTPQKKESVQNYQKFQHSFKKYNASRKLKKAAMGIIAQVYTSYIYIYIYIYVLLYIHTPNVRPHKKTLCRNY